MDAPTSIGVIAKEIVNFGANLIREAKREERERIARMFDGLYTDQQRPQNIAAVIRALPDEE